jgi:predicted ferric reductase
MRRLYAIRANALYLPQVITLVMWLLSKTRPGGWDVHPLQALSQVLSLQVLTAFAVVMVIAARNRAIEKLYGGLDKSYGTHGKLAKVAFFGMLAHPLLLIPSMLQKGIPAYGLLLPIGPWPEGFELARWFGVASYYAFIVLVLLTLYRRMGYQQWLTSHKFMGPAFAAGVVHTYLANSDVRAHEPLRDWVHIMVIAAVGAWLYKAILYPWAAQKYRYRLHKLKEMGNGIYEINLKPDGPRMNYEPGEFAFISVRGNPAISKESHPFSISSSPNRHMLRFSYREAGDYTKTLKNMRPQDPVTVYGPYGEFTSFMLDEYKKQVWVAGGIGVTPFLSMLGHEVLNEDHKQIYLYYSGKKRSDLVYDEEIQRQRAKATEAASGDWMHYIPHASDDEGFLSAERFEKECGGLQDTAFLFCGPPVMMRTLKKQLMAKGVPANRIFFEEFNFV